MDIQQMNFFEQLLHYYQVNGGYMWQQFTRHFLISVYGVLFATLIGIPIGIWIAHHKKARPYVMGLANLIQTIPALAMVSILMLAFGLGVTTVIVANFLYALLPVIANTYTGISSINPDVLDAAKGIGMSRWQRLLQVELPLSLSVMMAGVRNALVLSIGVSAIGTFIGAGGLGDIISRGVNATGGGSIILAGALPTALMAVLADFILGRVEKFLLKKVSHAE